MTDILDRSKVLLPMELPNTFRQYLPDSPMIPRHNDYPMTTQAYALIDALLAKHPTWMFVTNQSYSSQIGAFSVYEKDTYLGEINGGTDWKSRECYTYVNQRVRSALNRGSYRKTSKMATAVKEIEKYFYLPTLTERLTTANQALSGLISNTYSKTFGAFRGKWSSNENVLAIHVIGGTPIAEELRSELHGLFTTCEEIAVTMSARGAGLGCNCLIEPDNTTHLFEAGTCKHVTTVSFGDLPNLAQVKIGMLKLSGANGLIPRVGARVGNVFYTTNEELIDE